MSKVHSGLPWADFTYPYLGPDTHIFIDAPTQTARDDQDLIEEGIVTDDFDSDYYWNSVYNGDSVYEQSPNGNDSVIIIGG